MNLLKLPASFHFAFRKLSRRLGQPFNGQLRRQELFQAICARISISTIIETGANLGTTTRCLANFDDVPVFTCELDPARARFVSFRLRNRRGARVLEENSPVLLKEIVIPKLKKLACPFFFTSMRIGIRIYPSGKSWQSFGMLASTL